MESTLTVNELEYLVEILEEYLADLRTEILDTDSYEFKLGLRKKEETVHHILEKIERKSAVPVN